MSLRSRVTAMLAALIAAGLTLPATPALAKPLTPGATPSDVPGCAKPLLPEPQRAAMVRKQDRVAFETAAARNDRSTARFASLAEDKTLWLDRCGAAFYVEPQAAEGAESSSGTSLAGAATALPVGADPLALESRPGAPRTIYLDFTGDTVTNTAWNSTYSTIAAEPFSVDSVISTDFSADEKDQIFRAWLAVSEDYAPFDVNVTTKDPGAAAIDRTSSGDTLYGTRVLITNGGPLFDKCGCGGQGYLDVFSSVAPSHMYYQPAWVYADGLSKNGWHIGEAASHEAGHNFGLSHDGIGSQPYYSGEGAWAPIMGASYGKALSQWSAGEYAGATTTQDDVAIIALGAPLLPDDHGDTSATATPLDVYAPVDGVIGTRTDVDAFSFDASGPTTLTVTSPTDSTNLDVSLTIKRADGTTVATVNPTLSSTAYAHPVPAGLGATWTADLPQPGTYTAFVDGAGASSYTDYGSLGRYRVGLDSTVTDPDSGPPLTLDAVSAATFTVGKPVTTTLATATGGTTPYTWSASNLPDGLSIASTTGVVTGTPTQAAQDWQSSVTVRDAAGVSRASAPIAITVRQAERLAVPDQGLRMTATKSVSRALTASGWNTAPTWSVASGTVPAGLTLTRDGHLSGAVSTAGTYQFTVRASTPDSSATGRVTVVVDPAPLPPMITTTALGKGQVGDRYRADLAVVNAGVGTRWAITSGSLPSGLVLSTSYDGTAASLVGTPTRAAAYTFRVQVTTRDGLSDTQDLTMTIDPPVSFGTRGRLPDGRARKAYATKIALRHPTPGLSWSIVSGSLPPGLKLRPGNGRTFATVRGTPTRKGTWKFTVSVRERDGDIVHRTFRQRIR